MGLLVGWAGIGPALGDRVIGALAGFAALAAIAWAYRRLRGREGMGGGDPKLLAALGAWLGWRQLPFVLVGAGLIGLAAVAGWRCGAGRPRGHRPAAAGRADGARRLADLARRLRLTPQLFDKKEARVHLASIPTRLRASLGRRFP